jgi:hypothetical protein
MPNLHRPISMLVPPLVAYDLASIELQDCTTDPFGRLRVVDGCHALFDCEYAGAVRYCVLFSLESRQLGQRLRNFAGRDIEAGEFGRWLEDGTDGTSLSGLK